MKLLIALVLLLAARASDATTLDRVDLSTFLKEADLVALVSIESAEIVRVRGDSCGAMYRGRVDEAVKGEAKRGATILFGPFAGKGVGDQFLVFLTRKERSFSAIASTNSASMEDEERFEKECFEALPPYREMHEGFGSLPVHWTKKLDYKDGVLFMEEWVGPPQGLKRLPWAADDSEIISDRSWIKVDDVLTYLRSEKPRKQ